MPKPASLPVFWVPLHPAPGAINSTLNEMGVSEIPAAHPSGTLAHCGGWFGGQNNILANTDAVLTMCQAPFLVIYIMHMY